MSGYIQVITSLASIFYATATFPRKVRLLREEEDQIKTFSAATIALLIWRTLIVGSRIMAFVLFAALFRALLFVVVGVHYVLMFALVLYQTRLTDQKLIRRVVYNIVIPLVFVYDYCLYWLRGPTRYWYILCYVPMYCENLLMAALVMRYGDAMPRLAWYILPGCVCVMVMFPLGVVAQVAYYRLVHPKVRRSGERTRSQDGEAVNPQTSQPTQLRYMSWSEFREKVEYANRRERFIWPNKPNDEA